MSESPQDKPKIIVDSDWKEQVRAERQQRQGGASEDIESSNPIEPDSANASAADDSSTRSAADDIPEASFAHLVTSLATQAAVALGHFPDPIEGKPIVNRPLAKHAIDTLSIIQEKTKGNLDSQEETMLEAVLHQLRVVYVDSGKG